MNKKTVISFLLPFLVSTLAFAKMSIDEATRKLEGYQEANVIDANITVMTEAQLKDQDVIFDTLRDSVKLSISDPKNELLRREIMRVASLMLKKDPTVYAAEVILPLYKYNKKSFTKDAAFLGKEKAAELIEAIKSAEREVGEGNG